MNIRILKYIILDQAISPNNPLVIYKYFDRAKLIIVDRDPRDMYVDDILWGELLDKDLHTSESGRRYAIRQRALRGNPVEDSNVLYIRFENLILNYHDTTKEIMDFLGFEKKNHINERMFLKTELSLKNVGIWKKYYDKYKDALDTIAEMLPDLCYGE